VISDARARSGVILTRLAAAMLIAVLVSGCDLIGSGADEGGQETEDQQVAGSYAACLPWYETDVLSLDTSADGARWAYLSSRRPQRLPEDFSWRSDSRAVFVRDRDANGVIQPPRYVALPWSGRVEVPVYASPAPGGTGSMQPVTLDETVRAVDLSDDGARIYLGVAMAGVPGDISKLYVGAVPSPDDIGATLDPGEDGGLTEVPINVWGASEWIERFAVAPDGNQVAATVGTASELRVYDVDAGRINSYLLDDENRIVVSNENPTPETNIGVQRRAAVSVPGGRLAWAPDSDRIAFTRKEGVATSALLVLDVSDGTVELVRRFENTTLPHFVWSADGESLFVMTTQLSASVVFGHTEIRRIEATADGEDIGAGARIDREANWASEPSMLTGFGDDERFLFTWEGRLFRLRASGGNLAGAPYQIVTQYHQVPDLVRRGVSVVHEPLNVDVERDEAIYRVRDGRSFRIGVRTNVSADECPTLQAPEEGPR